MRAESFIPRVIGCALVAASILLPLTQAHGQEAVRTSRVADFPAEWILPLKSVYEEMHKHGIDPRCHILAMAANESFVLDNVHYQSGYRVGIGSVGENWSPPPGIDKQKCWVSMEIYLDKQGKIVGKQIRK